MIDSIKDMTGYVVRHKGQYYVDRFDLEGEEELVKPGDKISFTINKKFVTGYVLNKSFGRDEDMLLVDEII